MSKKHEVHIGTSFNNFTQVLPMFLNLKIMWGGLPSAISVEHVAVSCAVTVLCIYNEKNGSLEPQ